MTIRARAVRTGLALSMALAGTAARAEEPLVTDRPDFTESASTIARGRIQIEGGYTFTRNEDGDQHALGELLVRLGTSDTLEVRLGINSFVWQELPDSDASGLEDFSIGVKALLSNAPSTRARQPQVAVLVGTTVNTGGDQLGQPGLQPRATLALAWELGPQASLGSNLGYAWLREAGERFGELTGSLVLSRGLGDRLGGYVEYFGFAREGAGDDDHFLNAGLSWLLSADAQLDLRAGAGLNSAAADFFVGAGAAWRW